MTKPKLDPADRTAKVKAMQVAQRRADRRRTLVIAVATGVVVVALLATVAVVIVREQGRQAELQAAAAAPIDGVTEYADLDNGHVEGPVDYEQDPPVGGDHAAVWTNCGVYDEPLPAEQTVHSLEHGAVWLTYRSDLPADQVEVLTRLVEANDYALLSPVADLTSPVVASAWGRQLLLDDAADPRLEVFLVRYLQSEDVPEPGAPCTGGLGGV